MGYKVKWIEDNLGVTRKALRVFEDAGLMPKNQNSQHRDYSDEDIERIWSIRVLQGMGYSLKEIVAIVENVDNEEWDFHDSIAQKVEELERKKVDIERHIGYAKMIKLTGQFPSRPKELGTVRFEDFHEKALEHWNINDEPQLKYMQDFVDLALRPSDSEFDDNDLEKILNFYDSIKLAEMNKDAVLAESLLPKAILRRKHLGPQHQEVQLLVKLLYENQGELLPELKADTPQQFAKCQAVGYRAGDIAKVKEKEYGIEGCRFIADAIAIFGGYTGFDDPEL